MNGLEDTENIDYYRDKLGFFPINHTTGEEIYPFNYDPNGQYYIDNILYLGNIGFLCFIVNIGYTVIKNLKEGISYVIRMRIKGQPVNPYKGRSWD